MRMKTLWFGCLLLGLGLRVSVAADRVELAEPESDARVRSVRSHVTVAGELKTATGGGKTIPLKLSSDADYRFLERRLSGVGRDAEKLRSARLYRLANSDIEVVATDAPANATQPKRSNIRLPETKYLIIAHGRREGPFLYSPSAALTFDQLELIRAPGDSLALLGLLPPADVAVGDTWKPDSWAVQMLTGLEAMLKGELTCKLEETNARAARVSFNGNAEGATLGANASVEIAGEYLFDRQRQMIARAQLKQTEKRAVGAVSPGLEVTASVVVDRSLAEGTSESELLNDAAVKDIPLEPTTEMQFLRFEAWGIRFYHDRGWHLFHQTMDDGVFRLMDQGSLIAQCNIRPVPAAAAGSHTSKDQFQADIRQTLGKKLKSITNAEQLQPLSRQDRRFLLRVTVDGEADATPMTWFYHLCASPVGQQIALVFAVETKNLEKFADRDLSIIRLLDFLPSRPAVK